MATNMALKRARKAQRRKQVMLEKSRADAHESSLAAQVLRSAGTPVRCCVVTEGLFDFGMGSLVLARGVTSHQLWVGMFLIDVFCLGIKDAVFRQMDDEMLDAYLDASAAQGMPLADVEPGHARKLLRDLSAWSQSIGIPPHRDFAIAERLFGDVEASDAAFQFGRDGKPVYIPGPNDTPALVNRRLNHLRERLGDDGFDFGAAA
jgi:hypothetical protein